MSTKTKKSITEVIASACIIIGYIIFAFSNAAPAIKDIKGWATVMIITIGIGVGVMIAAEIIFHIAVSVGVSVKEEIHGNKDKKNIELKVKQAVKSVTLEDEMDKKIDCKANRIGFSIIGIGFISALIALACGASVFVALQIIFCGCFVGSMLDGVSKIFFYEKGIK